jgi:Phosphotransferase enzyme family
MTGWITFLYALFPHPDEPLVLTQSELGKSSLPRLTYNDQVWAGDTRVLKPIFEELISRPINILRYVAQHLDEEGKRMYFIYLLEHRDGNLLPNDLWQPIERILQDKEIPSVLHEALSRWQQEQQSGIIPERRAPWAIPGWHKQVEGWIADQVTRLGHGAIQSIEPVKSWSISCVLKVTTEASVLYFKSSRDLPLFVNEGAVLARLGELYPDRLPAPVAFAPEWGWMLLENFGDPLGEDVTLDQQAHFVQDFARLQIDSSRKIELLLASGCKDRRLESLPSKIDPLFNDELVLSLLTDEERVELKQFVPKLRDLIAELNALPVPMALLHGDLHAGNVIMRNNSFLYFDWTDAAISHPFFDMIRIFTEKADAKRTTLEDAYLAPWEEIYLKADVRRAWELAGTLHGLYHAVSYQYIVHGIENLVQPELNFAYYFLRKLLEGVKRVNANETS